jgi:uncharacterized membrane protein YbaN (DUF454 family)
VYVGLGLFFVGLGAAGTFLPVLPTTPFLLLASFFFIRSSPRLNDWLLRTRLFGPVLRDWQRHRAVRPRVKVTAVSVLVLFAGGSAAFGSLSPPLLVVLVVLALIGLVVVLRLPVVKDGPPDDPSPGELPPTEPPRPDHSQSNSVTAR